MSLVSKIVQTSANAIFSKGNTKTAKTVLDNVPLFASAKKAATDVSEVVRLKLKPDIPAIPIRPATIEHNAPAIPISYKNLNDENVKGEIGNLALRLERKYAQQLPEAQEKFSKMFPGMKVDLRSKSAASIYSKILKNVEEKKLTLTKDTDVESFLTDGVAGRLTLGSLTRKDVLNAVNNFKVNSKPLSARERRFLKRLLNNDAKLSKAQTKAVEKYVEPIKLQLAEKQSEQAFDSLMLSMLKDALERIISNIQTSHEAASKKLPDDTEFQHPKRYWKHK